MSSAVPEARFRRRVLTAGGLAAFALYVVGAPVFNNRIEDDLESRVPAALARAGNAGVTVKFSGQDGRIDCVSPLADPEAALDVAYGVRGVHSIELDRSCRVASAIESSISTIPATTTPATLPPTGSASTPGTSPTTNVSFATVGDVIAGDGLFSSLAVLLADADMAATLGDPDAGPFTVFAPTDSAFDALPSDTESLLSTDADVRERTLRGLVVEGALDTDDLAGLAGSTLVTLDGIELAVTAEGDTISVGGARLDGAPPAPLAAGGGFVYAVDRVLLPDGVAGAPTGAPVSAALERGTVTLTGTVASPADAERLATAAAEAVGADGVTDELTVDPETGAPPEVIDAVAGLLATFRTNLVAGQAGFDGARLYLSGSYPDQEGAAAARSAAEAVGATTDLQRRPDVTADQAAALQTELNAYVAANPILFEPGSAVLDNSAVAIVQYLATGLRQYGGMAVVVEGHTDSDGQPSANQTLSEQRAAAVRQALVDLGVDAAAVTSAGFGSSEPVLQNGIENKSASRRVEFEITAGQP